MSAFIVSKAHIDAMVWAAEHYTPRNYRPFRWHHNGERYLLDGIGRADEVGRMLWAENVKSVSHRYPNDTHEELPGPKGGAKVEAYSFTPPKHGFSIGEMLLALDGYEYQTCEHDGWEASEAHAFVHFLRKNLIRALPEYSNAKTWAI